jgi:O-antigen ligase
MDMTTISPARPSSRYAPTSAARGSVLPVAVFVVFLAYGFQGAGPAIGSLRWLLLVALAGVALLRVWHEGGGMPIRPTLVALGFFTMLAVASTTYSIIPRFSLFKSAIFAIGMLGLVAGIGLQYRHRPDIWLTILASFNLLVVGFTLVVAPVSSTAYDSGFLQGPFSNPNALGSVLALTFPAVLWFRQRRLRERRSAVRWTVLSLAVVANVVFVGMTRSRASLLVLLITLLLYAALRSSRPAALLILALVALTLASPLAAQEVVHQAVFKGRGTDVAFTNRAEELRRTLEAAASAPITGYGFGTSVGDTSWDGSLSSVSATREKTNAYLGTVEEVGVVGALPLLVAILTALGVGYRWSRSARSTAEDAPSALFLVVAAGALHCNFEAWLTSIGSYEAFIFWSTLGVLLMAEAYSARRRRNDD